MTTTDIQKFPNISIYLSGVSTPLIIPPTRYLIDYNGCYFLDIVNSSNNF